MTQKTPVSLAIFFLSFSLVGPLSAAETTAEPTTETTSEDNTADTPANDSETEEKTAEEGNDTKAETETASGTTEEATEGVQTEGKPEQTAPAAETVPQPEPTEAEPAPEQAEQAAPSATAQNAAGQELDEPTQAESRTIAWVFAGLTAASLAGGVYAGLQAQEQFDCLSDVLACNDNRDTPIENDDFIKAKSDLDRITLLADMGYLTAVVTSTVTIAAIVRALTGGSETKEEDQRTSMLSVAQE